MQDVRHVTDGELPLGLSVSEGGDGAAVEITGLPTGSGLSAGLPVGANGWRIMVPDLANAVVRPPPRFAGAIDLVVELRLSDQKVVDRRYVALELRQPATGFSPGPPSCLPDRATWPPRVMWNAGAYGGICRPAGGNETTTFQAEASSARRVDSRQIDLLLTRAAELFSAGYVAGARLLLERAAQAHDARAAFELGATFDPIVLERFKFHGAAADPAKALTWYAKAKEFAANDFH